MKRSYMWVSGGAVALVLLVVGGASLLGSGEQDSGETPGTIVSATRKSVTPALAVTGFVISPSERSISPKASGEVKSIKVGVGSRVKKGQTLIILSKVEAERELEVAQSAYYSAWLKLDDLIDASASDSQISDQRAAYKRALADKESAEAALADTVVRSPIKGTVLSINAYAGERVTAGSSGGGSSSGSSTTTGSADGTSGSEGLVTVADLSRLQVETTIDQSDIAKIYRGQKVSIVLDAIPDRKFAGKVVRVDPVPQTTNNVVTYSAYISFAKKDKAIRLGMSADLDIDLGAKKNVITVPSAAILSRNGSRAVLRVAQGVPTPVEVKVGVTDGATTEIVSGLSEGDQVLIRRLSGGSSGGFGGGGFGGGGFSGPPPGAFGGQGGAVIRGQGQGRSGAASGQRGGTGPGGP